MPCMGKAKPMYMRDKIKTSVAGVFVLLQSYRKCKLLCKW